ncbi:hypothetical protein QQP08_023190 [Theobroma cacao]|uniref:Uncharacterized protein n=1 Tax=Theobroma cacao TaxID=3641 RepID=A0A061FGW4_THECC|nr:Uncharacterized protein TCM_034882 [Theobroma cacao]WRX30703.1 hypothetical protein QQP08_023190 [Theobroma cacao]
MRVTWTNSRHTIVIGTIYALVQVQREFVIENSGMIRLLESSNSSFTSLASVLGVNIQENLWRRFAS